MTETQADNKPAFDVIPRAYFASMGKRGGASKSAAKLASALSNLAKARAARWPAKAKAKEAV